MSGAGPQVTSPEREVPVERGRGLAVLAFAALVVVVAAIEGSSQAVSQPPPCAETTVCVKATARNVLSPSTKRGRLAQLVRAHA